MRSVTQVAAELVYRFPAGKENFWIGGRFNSLTAEIKLNAGEINISRVAGSAGWFITKHIMLKAEYMNQVYNHFAANDIRSGAQFNGLITEAVIGF